MLLANYKQKFHVVLTSTFLCLAAFHGDREMNGTEDSVLYTVEHNKQRLCTVINDTRLRPGHTTLKEFENGGFTLKHIKCFQFTLRRRNLKTQQAQASLDLCLKQNPAAKSRDYRDVIVFPKKLLFKMFSFHMKRKAGVFKFLRFQERFR